MHHSFIKRLGPHLLQKQLQHELRLEVNSIGCIFVNCDCLPNMNKITNPGFSAILQETHKILENSAIITYMSHRAKYYCTSVSKIWYLITVPNMNDINSFFYEISQQIHKMYEKVGIIIQIWQRVQCYFTSLSNVIPEN